MPDDLLDFLLGCGCRKKCCCQKPTPAPPTSGGNLFQTKGKGRPSVPPPDDPPFIPPRPVDFTPLPSWGAGLIAGIGAAPPVVHVGVHPGGENTLANWPADPIGTALRTAAASLNLPYPLWTPGTPRNGDTPYSDVEVIGSTVAGSQVLILATVSYHMPAFDPQYAPNVRPGYVPIYLSGLFDPLAGTFTVTGSVHAPAPVEGEVPYPVKGAAPVVPPPQWLALTGGHVTHPLTLDALIQPPAPHGSTLNPFAVISSEAGRTTVLTALHYLQRTDPLTHAYFWRRIEATASSLTVTDTPAPDAWLPSPVPDLLGVAPLWSGQTPGGDEVLAVRFTASGQAAEQAFTFNGGTPALLGPGALYASTDARPAPASRAHHAPVINGEALFSLVNWPDQAPSGGRWNVSSGEWIPDLSLSYALLFYDLRDRALHVNTPLPLNRSPATLTASQPARVTEALVNTRVRLYATGSQALRDGDTVTLGGVEHAVYGASGTAFEVIPQLPFALESEQLIPHTPWQSALTWDGRLETFPAALPNPSWLPAAWVQPTASDATPPGTERVPGRWAGRLPNLTGVNLDREKAPQRRSLLTARAGDTLTLTFPAVTPSPLGATLLLTARAPQGGTLTIPRPGSSPVTVTLTRRWTQHRVPLGSLPLSTVTLTASAPTQLSVAVLELDATA